MLSLETGSFVFTLVPNPDPQWSGLWVISGLQPQGFGQWDQF